MIPVLVEDYGVRRLYAVFKRTNHRSQRLLVRLGFSPASPALEEALGVEPDELLMVREAG
jgi:RimJ/RimL family protein N-acetyltransferase